MGLGAQYVGTDLRYVNGLLVDCLAESHAGVYVTRTADLLAAASKDVGTSRYTGDG